MSRLLETASSALVDRVTHGFHVLCGRRIVATKRGPCAREVALDYVGPWAAIATKSLATAVNGIHGVAPCYRADGVNGGSSDAQAA